MGLTGFCWIRNDVFDFFDHNPVQLKLVVSIVLDCF